MNVQIELSPEEAVAHVERLINRTSDAIEVAKLKGLRDVLCDLREDSRCNNLRAAMLEQSSPPRHSRAQCGTNKCPRCNYDVYEADLANDPTRSAHD